jgi:methyl-accepting chemotaxis protein
VTFAISLSRTAKVSELARYESGKAMAKARSEEVRSFLESKVSELKALEKSVIAKKNLDDKSKAEVLSTLLYSFADGPAVSDVYVVFDRGAYFSEKLTKPGLSYNIDAFHPEDGGPIQVYVDTSYGITDQDDWYNGPKETKSMHLTEPYSWTYEGEKNQRDMITLSSPLIVDGKFIGAVGVDIELDLLQKQVFDGMMDKEAGSYAILISNMGLIAAHPDKTRLLQKAGFDVPDHDKFALLQAIRKGEYFRAIKHDDKTGEAFLATYVPMKLTGVEAPDRKSTRLNSSHI